MRGENHIQKGGGEVVSSAVLTSIEATESVELFEGDSEAANTIVTVAASSDITIKENGSAGSVYFFFIDVTVSE